MMLYIHIPYCKGKCIYCDFYSAGNPDWEKYLNAVVNEFSQRIGEINDDSISSVYIGGGTPSLIPGDSFLKFISKIKSLLHEAKIEISPKAEFTVEVNPEDVNPQKVLVWKETGVNRVSMGVQSMDDSELQFLRRRHNAERVKEALSLLKNHFNNISVDVIYGIPGQSLQSLKNTIDSLLRFEPTHFSAYSLTYESGTPLYVFREKNLIQELDEEKVLELEKLLIEKLSDAGFVRYEISNYSLPRFPSQHNSGYWSGKPYLGLGPSAASYDGKNIRRYNPSDLKRYITHFSAPTENGFCEEEHLSLAEQIEEYIFTRLRRREGICLEDFRISFGEDALNTLTNKVNKWIESGHLLKTGKYISLSDKGIQISDFIFPHLI